MQNNPNQSNPKQGQQPNVPGQGGQRQMPNDPNRQNQDPNRPGQGGNQQGGQRGQPNMPGQQQPQRKGGQE